MEKIKLWLENLPDGFEIFINYIIILFVLTGITLFALVQDQKSYINDRYNIMLGEDEKTYEACRHVNKSFFSKSITFTTKEGKTITYKGDYQLEKI